MTILLGLAAGAVLLAAASLKWTLPRATAAGLILIGTAAGAAAGAAAGRLPATAAAAWCFAGAIQGATFLGVLAWMFYRDPERNGPRDPGLVLSPADGRVIYIRTVSPQRIPVAEKKGRLLALTDLESSALGREELWQVGIAMVFTDVHVNRAPVGGVVSLCRHRPGRFLSLRNDDAAGLNERQSLVISSAGVSVGLVQIASRLVRRIRAYVREGDTVERGQRVGVITLGSQVDVLLPVAACAQLEVTVGSRVRAGLTVLARTAAAVTPGGGAAGV